MGITSFIKTRLLNNRVEQYNTKRSYWGEDERQPRTDWINRGLDLVDAITHVVMRTPTWIGLKRTRSCIILIRHYWLGMLKRVML